MKVFQITLTKFDLKRQIRLGKFYIKYIRTCTRLIRISGISIDSSSAHLIQKTLLTLKKVKSNPKIFFLFVSKCKIHSVCRYLHLKLVFVYIEVERIH